MFGTWNVFQTMIFSSGILKLAVQFQIMCLETLDIQIIVYWGSGYVAAVGGGEDMAMISMVAE